ncbi:MAG: hypothetical protein R3359_01415 [Marinirhabdus sp.]|nr:hypothetical protein [Marinirhabdus sp.]
MFKRVVNYPGFWKSVVVLSIIYGFIMYVIQFGLEGNWGAIVHYKWSAIAIFVMGSFLVGFFIAYGKFWRKLKEQDYRDKSS